MKIRMALFFSVLLLVWTAFFWIVGKHESENISDNADVRHEMTRVRILKPVIDVGEVGSDTVVSATFHVVNVGDDSLFVAFVNPDCMCTKYVCSSNKVAKGDTLNVDLYSQPQLLATLVYMFGRM